jgi:hypothetical protein
MLHAYDHTTQLMVNMIMEERLEQAERFRMLRQAGSNRRGWLLRLGCWLLGRAGGLMVTIGRRLQQYEAPQPVTLEST